ncbi:hypothetical protein HOD20_05715 [archaeon]|jgi:uncharacterized protein|nr:hypothetical protein [archaeon]MBT4352001.1 hypothetical protein [archaeon]MBT4646807.1 hypothetical protein [archaeon]MBT6821483.1 hypothetical protein [archaeon]MBT7392965.1 hypothetical protein [archaeon]
MINDQLIESLEMLKEDHGIPRNIKTKIGEISQILKSNEDNNLKINKALNILDEISNDDNLQSFTRTQIWNLVSMLEAEE